MSDTSVQKRRIQIIAISVAVLGAVIIARLFSLQVINKQSYRDRAEHQYITPNGDVFDRGNIYFTDKDGITVAAATIENGFKIAINPNLVSDPEKTYQLINAITPLSHDDFFTKAAKKGDPYEQIADRLNQDQADAVTALRLPGVSLYRQKWRFYPGGVLASKAIGFVSYKNNDLVGNYGLEDKYNAVLSRSTDNLYVNFFAEIFANMQSSVFKNTTPTGDVVTSIEPTVQSQLEQIVADTHAKWSTTATGGIIMDPNTGEIIAMAQVPTFDLNNYGAEKDVSVYNNTFVQNAYEMGSIVKPLVMAGAVDSGTVTPQTTYFDPGHVVVGGKTIYNFDKRGRGTASMQDVLNQSLNTGMVFVEQKMGQELFKHYMIDTYKIGERTGIDLPSEIKGLVSNLNTPNDVNYADAAFGQGIALTPISIVRGFSILANGGYLVTPHLATSINEQNGFTKKLEYPKSGPLLKPETVATMRVMLTHVVDDGYHRGLSHYTVGAKTGTAQIAKPGGAGYYDDRNLHSMIGFFPATNPRYILYLYDYYPKGVPYSIQDLGGPFFDMVQFMINYYSIAPDR